MALSLQLLGQLPAVGHRLLPIPRLQEVELGVHEVLQEYVPLDDVAFARPHHEDGLHAHLGTGGADHSSVVGDRDEGANEAVAAPLQGIGDAELDVAGLVPTEGQARQVVPLDEDAGATQGLREAGALLQRGGSIGHTRPWNSIDGRPQIGFGESSSLDQSYPSCLDSANA